MGFRIKKSIKLGKFARINLSKSGVSLSGGVKGARVSINNKGVVRKSVGVPGTDIYYSKQHKIDNEKETEENKVNEHITFDSNVKNYKSKWLPIWLSNWLGISFIMMLLGSIGAIINNGIIMLFLPIAFVSLLSSIVVYFVKYIKCLKSKSV